MIQFGGRVRQLRQQKGLTLRALAEAAGFDFTYLSKIENGKVEYTPSVPKIRALARVLGADELELLDLANKTPPEIDYIARNPSARVFFRRARRLTAPEDWEDLLRYLDRRESARPGSAEGDSSPTVET